MTFEICKNCKPNGANLPDGLPNMEYLLCENNRGDDGNMSIILRCSGSTEQDARDWLRDYSVETRSVWRIQCAHPESGRKNVFKTEYRCQHNTRHKRRTSAKRKPSLILKNMECPAKLTIIVKRVPKRSRSMDKHLPQFPMVIHLKNDHNHSPDCLVALRHRDVSSEVRSKFEMMYKDQRHSPGTALTTHLHDLHQEHGDDIYSVLSDRSLCPDRGWCYSLYYKVFNKEYRDRGPDSRVECLGAVLNDYDRIIGHECSRLFVMPNNEFACAIVTPLMSRNHQLNFHAGEICYVDSNGKCDRDKTAVKVYLLLTDSEAGGIPLGILAVSSDSENVLYEAWMLYKGMLQDNFHYGRGLAGPQVFMTEDCDFLRNAIGAVFPESTLLLSIPHIIQATWRYLCNQGNGVPVNKRVELIHAATRLLYCNSEDELDAVFCDTIDSNAELTHQYSKFQDYLRQQIFSKRKLWAPCLFRQGVMIRGHSSLSISETTMRVVKDIILHRLRTYNLPQMAHFVFTRMDEYYGRRLQDVVNDREGLAARRRFVLNRTPVLPENITQISTYHYHVAEGQKIVYEVDTSIGICSCVIGVTSGAPCKHQHAIAVLFGYHTLLPQSDCSSNCHTTAKICLYQIATGRRVDIPDDWFKQHQSEEVPLSNADIQKVEVVEVPSLPPQLETNVIDETSDEENQEQTQETLHKFTSVFSKLKDKYLKDPSLYGPALEQFCSTLEAMPSDSSLVPALTNFGKYGAQNENTLEIPMSGWFN